MKWYKVLDDIPTYEGDYAVGEVYSETQFSDEVLEDWGEYFLQEVPEEQNPFDYEKFKKELMNEF